MQSIEKIIQLAGRNPLSVLITGPTGAGKSTLAKRIHQLSPRASKPFVTINFASLYEGTLESEIFGHEKGAFTGADQKKLGLLEQAHGGTVFLDEIGELQPKLQQRLLQFLHEKTILPVGGTQPKQLDVRVIAATNKNLEQEVREKKFREDLFYRLNVIPIELPKISENPLFFGESVHLILEKICSRKKVSIQKLSSEFAHALEAYSWPGNYRELENVLEYAVAASQEGVLALEHLPPGFAKAAFLPLDESIAPVIGQSVVQFTSNYMESLEKFEKEYLQCAYLSNSKKINQMSEKIGMSKVTLLKKLSRYGIRG